MCNWMVCLMNAQAVCEKIIKELLKEGYIHQFTRRDLERAIMKVRNIVDERAIDRWVKALMTFEYIEQKHYGIFVFNPFSCPEIFKTLKDKPQTKLS